MIDKQVAKQGIDAAFLSSVREKLEQALLAKASSVYAQGKGPDHIPRQELKPLERIVHFYDYQACSISTLARISCKGDKKAYDLVRTIIENSYDYYNNVKKEQNITIPLRRLLLHIALAYSYLKSELTPDEEHTWNEIASYIAEDVTEHNHGFYPSLTEIHNRTLGTGTNHAAVCAEGLFFAGVIFEKETWHTLAQGFIARLVEFCHTDGYFEENTNDKREGGPSLDYTNLSAGAAFQVCRAAGLLDQYRNIFVRCSVFSRLMSNTELKHLAFADERTNRETQRMFGLALHSLTSEGSGYIRLKLEQELLTNFEHTPPDMLARLDFELDAIETGKGTVPEPWQEGDAVFSLPFAVHRSSGWTCGISALKAFNREIALKSDYALDRQNLLYLSHERTGTILPGFKSKNDPLFSTVCIGDDAYPVEAGTICIEKHRITAEPVYRCFKAHLCWNLISASEAVLLIQTDSEQQSIAQLPVRLDEGENIRFNGSDGVSITSEDIEISGITSLTAHQWTAELSEPADFLWPVIPHDPYNIGNKATEIYRIALIRIPFIQKCTIRFLLPV
jgi:hypothetical protein